MRYRLLSFDGDMTLWDFDTGMRTALERVRGLLIDRRPHLAATLVNIAPMMAIRDRILAAEGASGLSFAEIRRRAFQALLAEHDRRDDRLADQLYTAYLQYRLGSTPLYADTAPFFAGLDPGPRLALLSNGNTHPQRLGIADYFDVIAFADDAHRPKPAADMFSHALMHTGCSPTEMIHIGDGLDTDIAGANAIGATSVWLNREGRENDTAIVPDYTITSLAELNALLYRHRRM
ncbi:HAD family hydrolase [Salinisphaera sp. T5B8]|uniref:HAD family hydrolase n=1 Tax=Salinisphaera sp. T5B8 TaxID=1304154 RepID=UPI0033429BD8